MEVIEYWNPLVRRHRPTAGSSQFEAGIDTPRRYVCVFEVNSSGSSGTACCIAWSIRASSAAKCWNWICLTRAAKPNRPSATSKTAGKHAWAFAPRFRRVAFGWRSEPAIARIKKAMVAIKAISKKDVLLAAEGAVLFLQKASPALPNIDSSSGAIGSAVTRAIDVLVPIIAKAPTDMPTRRKWLEQLYQAHADDAIPYIESLGSYWGELCAAPDLLANWQTGCWIASTPCGAAAGGNTAFFMQPRCASRHCSSPGGTNCCSPC